MPRLPSIAYAGGILTAASFFIAITAVAVATLHPEVRSPELIRTLNDFAVMTGLPVIAGATAFFGAIALVIFRSAFAGDGVLGFLVPLAVSLIAVVALSALLTAWARDAARPGGIGITDRIRGGVTGAVTGAAARVRGERPPAQRPPQ